MHQLISTPHTRSTSTSASPPQHTELADLTRLAVPKLSSLNKEEPAPERSAQPSAASGDPYSPSLGRSIAILNAKIALGHLGAFSTLVALAYAGVSGFLHNASVVTLAGLAVISTVSLVIKGIRTRNAINELSSVPPAPDHLEHIARAKRIVHHLCQRNNIPEPHIAISPERDPNAGMIDRLRGKDILTMTQSLLGKLNDRELQAVIAHELAHQNRWYSRFFEATVMASAWIKPIASWGTMFLALGALAPTTGIIVASSLALVTSMLATTVVATVVGMFGKYVSRQNEIKTDLRSCRMTGDPEALISALSKLEPSTPEYVQLRRALASLGLLSHPSWEERARHIRNVFGRSS